MYLIIKQRKLEAKVYHQGNKILIKSKNSQFKKKVQDTITTVEKQPLILPWGETIETETETIVRDGIRMTRKEDKDYLHALATALYERKKEFDIELSYTDSQNRVRTYTPLSYFIEEK